MESGNQKYSSLSGTSIEVTDRVLPRIYLVRVLSRLYLDQKYSSLSGTSIKVTDRVLSRSNLVRVLSRENYSIGL
jgi:hypothetical protein